MICSNKTIIVVCGITASGKSDLAFNLARKYNTEIISTDSRQIYKELVIGVDRPPQNYLREIKHHMIGSVTIKNNFSVGDFFNKSVSLINNIFKYNDYIVVVGGNGLYMNSLLYGINNIPSSNIEIRNKLIDQYDTMGIDFLKMQLFYHDISYYNNVDLKNYRRILRALEVYYTTKIQYSYFIKKNNKNGIIHKYKVIQIAIKIDKKILKNNIYNRVDKMINNGLLNEAYQLLPYKYYNAVNTIGYKELFLFFEKKINLNDAIQMIKNNTLYLAKKQHKWLKKQKNIFFVKQESNIDDIVSLIN